MMDAAGYNHSTSTIFTLDKMECSTYTANNAQDKKIGPIQNSGFIEGSTLLSHFVGEMKWGIIYLDISI